MHAARSCVLDSQARCERGVDGPGRGAYNCDSSESGLPARPSWSVAIAQSTTSALAALECAGPGPGNLIHAFRRGLTRRGGAIAHACSRVARNCNAPGARSQATRTRGRECASARARSFSLLCALCARVLHGRPASGLLCSAHALGVLARMGACQACIRAKGANRGRG